MMDITLRQPYSFCQLGRRGNQEDARFPDNDSPQGCKPVFVVCDGVGGQDKGEVASRTVADAIGKYMSRVDLTRPFTGKDFSKVLDYAYDALNRAMTRDTREMATTLTFVCFHGGGVYCAHIGDSRIYHIRPGVGIINQSDDHSLVNSLVHSGNITPEEAINHPQSNVITRCMCYTPKGQSPSSASTLEIKDVQAGDYFFLCSDGVLHKIDDTALYNLLCEEIPDKEKIRRIAEASRNSSDNNTAYLIGVEQVEEDTAVKPDTQSSDASDGEMVEMVESADESATTPITQPNLTAREVAPSEASAGKKISKFLKSLFG
ncbi:MAG: serine/threonine-protein phosphatase [Bacteroides sp.]|nr:serine/threonine-protein phosphatase [Bacteroides sp.]